MDSYIKKQLDIAKELLESGVEFRNKQMIDKAKMQYDSLKPLTLNSENWETVKENMIRACTALCLFDAPNALNHLNLALTYDSKHPVILNNLGYIYHTQHSNWSKSIENYETCLLSDRGYSVAYLGIIDVYRTLRHHQLEYEYCQKGVKNCPESPELLNALGLAMLNIQMLDDLSKIKNCFTKALTKNPSSECKAKIMVNMGHINGLTGDYALAILNYIEAIDNDPTHVSAYQNILMNIHYFCDRDVQIDPTLKKLISRFDIDSCCRIDDIINLLHKKMVSILYPNTDKYQVPDLNKENVIDRKIIVGYVTSDLIDHAVSFFVKSLFTHYNSSAFEIYIYSNSVYDTGTINEIKCTGYRCIKGVSAVDSIRQIKNDQVDILIDLSGHTSGNRLDIFAMNPCPIMLSYCGYPNNTGLKNVKRISDVYTEKFNKNQCMTLSRCPEKPNKVLKEHFCESGLSVVLLQRLFLCYTPKQWKDLTFKSYTSYKPSENTVVFGCFAKLQKINKHVISLWKQILERMPKSKLILKSKYFEDSQVVSQWKQKFKGVQDQVVLMPGTKTTEEHLNAFKSIDIHLDTFPYSGTTITTESLFMNVPVITLSIVNSMSIGHVQRVSGSILMSLGFAKEMIANTEDDYITKSIELAKYLPNLPSVRKRFLSSDISSSKNFMNHFEMMLSDQFLEKQMK